MIKKLVRSLFGIAFAALLAFAPAFTVSAKPATPFDGYDYTVRFLAGAQGTFKSAGVKVISTGQSVAGVSTSLSSDGSVITVSGIPYGSRIVFDTSGEEREKLTVSDLLEKFKVGAGEELDNDRVLLS